MKIKLTEEQVELLDNHGAIITTENIEGKNTYQFLPFWFKKTDDKNVFELLLFEKLPGDLLESIKDERIGLENFKKQAMDVLIWNDKTYREIPEQDNPNKSECLIICKQEYIEPPKINTGKWMVIYCKESISSDFAPHTIGLFWDIKYAELFANVIITNI